MNCAQIGRRISGLTGWDECIGQCLVRPQLFFQVIRGAKEVLRADMSLIHVSGAYGSAHDASLESSNGQIKSFLVNM